MHLPKPPLLIPCVLLSEMKAVTCCEFSCSQIFQPSSAGWCCAFPAEQVWMPSVGTHWHSFTKSFSHPENGAAAPDAGRTSDTGSDNHRAEHRLRMRSNNTEKKFPDCESHGIPTPHSPDTAQSGMALPKWQGKSWKSRSGMCWACIHCSRREKSLLLLRNIIIRKCGHRYLERGMENKGVLPKWMPSHQALGSLSLLVSAFEFEKMRLPKFTYF